MGATETEGHTYLWYEPSWEAGLGSGKVLPSHVRLGVCQHVVCIVLWTRLLLALSSMRPRVVTTPTKHLHAREEWSP